MRPLKDIKKWVSRVAIRTRPQANKAILGDLLREFAACEEDLAPVTPRAWKEVITSSTAKLAAAVVVVAIIGLLTVPRSSRETGRQEVNGWTQTAGDMLTVGYLNAACRRGGLSEVERQCDRAADRLNVQPETVSAEELLDELNGT